MKRVAEYNRQELEISVLLLRRDNLRWATWAMALEAAIKEHRKVAWKGAEVEQRADKELYLVLETRNDLRMQLSEGIIDVSKLESEE